jgi:hypothetical protein
LQPVADLLRRGALGDTHSVAQTVGYKMGMIIGGGVLLQIAELTGMAWPGFFVCMAGIVVRLSLLQFFRRMIFCDTV